MKSKPITLKQFPEELYRQVKAKAALLSISVPELFKRAVEQFLNGRRK